MIRKDKRMKLNLGCGSLKIEDYDNIDIKEGRLAYPLDVPECSCDIIRASHLLEHFDSRQIHDVLKNWVSKLKEGGILKIAVPDFKKIASAYINKESMNVSGYIMGGQSDKDDYHKSIFDIDSLTELLKSCGLTNVTEWKSEIQDCASFPISLNLQGVKEKNTAFRKIIAVMSLPRLSFTDHVSCLMQEIVAHGINVKMGTGVFWGQVLTRGIEKAIEDNPDYIVTIDYDTWFKHKHLEHLLALMELNPEIDALCPVQMKRESESPMMAFMGQDGKRLTQINHSELEKEVLPIITGHFGLTVFRPSCFAKMAKPWFHGQPGPDGRWEDGRLDDDIYFWENFRKCGNKLFIANKVNIGHLQLLCTFPGHYTENFKCIHVNLGDLNKPEMIPSHCIS
jgi:predicted SAM-dependent methyltransferase